MKTQESTIEGYNIESRGNLRVIFRVSDDYINISKICRILDWLDTDAAQKFLIEFDNPIQQVDNGPISIRGIYAHPLLAPFIAAWTSPELGIRLAEIYVEYKVKISTDVFKEQDTCVVYVKENDKKKSKSMKHRFKNLLRF